MKDGQIRLFKILMWLVMVHSMLVGFLLLIIPVSYLEFFGYEPYSTNFFQAQGAVFHLVMCVAYAFSAINPVKNYPLIVFSIYAKCIAFIFLCGYYFFVSSIWVVLFSGVTDLMMGILIFILSRNIKKIQS